MQLQSVLAGPPENAWQVCDIVLGTARGLTPTAIRTYLVYKTFWSCSLQIVYLRIYADLPRPGR